ncbi:MAG: protein phosphatase 2C domain-containing protein [Gemmataceae bacterium]|nr:protein phosphatase 2C domain-containing protein [Gemmataceae bacterium]
MALALNIGKCTLLGNYRENNEDSIEAKQFPDLSVCIVADGMGGQAAGEIASKKAIEIVPKEIRKLLPAGADAATVKTAIRKSIVQANDEIIAQGTLDKDLKNMGTTIVVALWRKTGEMYIAGVGDSRAYLIRGGEIRQLTIDHSLAEALVQAGTISRDEAREHKFKNVLWKYLGSREVGEGPDVHAETVQAGDRFLMCTDGLSGVVSDEKILEFANTQPDAQACADGLGQFALDNGSRDNVSTIVIDVVEAR